MRRKFVNNLFFILLINLLVKPFWILGIDVSVQNRVGAEEYGFYYPIFGFSILLNIILDFGITNYNNRNIAQHGQQLKRYFSGIFNVKFILGIVYMLVTISLALVIGYRGKAIWFLFVLGINQFLSSMILYLRSNISGLHYFKLDGVLSVMDRLLMIIICSWLLWGNLFEGQFQIEWFVYAQFWAYFLTALFAFFMVFREARHFKLKLDLPLFFIILKQSMPFALLVLLMAFYYRLDSVMIERLLPNGRIEVGIYAQAYRILEGFNMFGFLFAGLLLPIFSKMIKIKESVSKLVNTAFNLIFIPAIAVVTISMLYDFEIMDLLYLEHVEESARVYKILMLSFVAIALTYIYGTLLTANGNLRQLNLISLFGLFLNLGLNFWLIPKHGAYGAAIATLATQFFVVMAQIIMAKRIFRLSYSFSFIMKQALLVLLGVSLAFYSRSLVPHFVFHSILIVVVFGVFSFLLGLVRKEEVMAIIRYKKED